MTNSLLILIGKLVSFFSSTLNLGNGSTWPGHIALLFNKNFIRDLISHNSKLITVLVAGTNGKTTTGKLIQTILEKDNKKVFQNSAGANLLNGIASSLLMHSSLDSKVNYDYAVFEVDENSLPLVLNELTPDYLILLNLFRDQLDRYGEVNSIALKWKDAIETLSPKTKLILNADDPQIAHLGLTRHSGKPKAHPESDPGQARMTFYFGLNDKNLAQTTHQHAADSTHCLTCGSKLTYDVVYFSHIGIWKCTNCGEKRPKIDLDNAIYPLPGNYNKYNTLAGVLTAKTIGINQKTINEALKNFTPAFGRQEIIEVDDKRVQLFLSKNPTSFNQSLRTIKDVKGKNLLLVLNDQIPDGRDISWIWDVDFEEFIEEAMNITISGDRCFDMGLRIKYTQTKIPNTKYKIQENLGDAITSALAQTPKSETLYILPTYSAMLEVRKILTGKKIL